MEVVSILYIGDFKSFISREKKESRLISEELVQFELILDLGLVFPNFKCSEVSPFKENNSQGYQI
jgi:hypothetical protein